ncbi:hypothetical protein FN976_26445 [Caenimonas sedimenti]|uniref:Uncharacterized protein n=1 Tax=Caenimonas sedimenti TaxID=2596921 RepID=A0A562ZFM0_9BURK|nr:hypothetical protein FN976_26445 [Caenimonas sedimenti]
MLQRCPRGAHAQRCSWCEAA